MEISNREVDNITILDISGEIDLYNAPDVKDTIRQHIEKGNTRIIINLKNVNYIDSSGIGALISSLSNLKKVGGGLKIIHVYDAVRKVFELTKLTSFFDIYDNQDAAIADFLS
ncbi:MAG TPA: STAS domain-containing protein [Spirochaetota bacterium]|nr:STAS domain-containing protein [Spirochaetota bacterium]